MKITIRTSGKTFVELQVGTTHHPHTGPLPQVGETIVIPENADVDPDAKGPLKVKKIIWHYSPDSTTLWPEIVCKPV
jgi:hypothetical protein